MYKTALPLKVFRLCLFVLPVRVTCWWIRAWSNGRMIVEGGNISTPIKKKPVSMQLRPSNECTAIDFRTPRWKAGERPLSDGTAMKPEFDLQVIWPVSTSEKKTHCFHTANTEWLWMLKLRTGSPCYSKNHAKHIVMRNERSCVPALGMHSNHRALNL